MRITIFKLVLVGLHKIIFGHLINLGDERNMSVHRDRSNRITKGDDAVLEEFPFLVQFLNHGGLCAGTIITKKIVMTAAHCFDANTDLNEMMVFSQSRYIFDNSALAHNVFDFIKHERYSDVTFSNDIAILMIVDTFEFGVYVNKGILADSLAWMNESVNVMAAGWGETKYGANKPDPTGLLKATTLHYVSLKKCENEHKMNLTPDMLCLFSERHQDTCRGDSGGGVVWNGTIIGIVSHGSGCGSTPAVYMNVFHFKRWISRTVRRLNHRFCLHLEKNKSTIILLK